MQQTSGTDSDYRLLGDDGSTVGAAAVLVGRFEIGWVTVLPFQIARFGFKAFDNFLFVFPEDCYRIVTNRNDGSVASSRRASPFLKRSRRRPSR